MDKKASPSAKTATSLNPKTPTKTHSDNQMDKLSYRLKLWMVNSKDEAVFGDGLARLLEAIDQHHSLLEAAKTLGMSYRYALHRITLAEERLGESLVTRVRGGAKGGGSSEVTAFGKDLVARYRSAQKKLGEDLKQLP